MRVLFVTFAARSHLYHQVPLAWALRGAGHEVRVAGQPDLADAVTGAGLTAVPVGEPLGVEQTLEEDHQDPMDPGSPDLRTLLDLNDAMTTYVYQPYNGDRMIDDLVAFARCWQPDLVLWDPLTFAGPVAAAVVGAAHARLLFGSDLTAQLRDNLRRLSGPDDRDALAEWLDGVLRRFGRAFTEEVASGHWTVDPMPEWLRMPLDVEYVPVNYVPHNGQSVVPRWLWAPPERRRVCLTLGFSHRELHGGDEAPVRELVAALGELDAEVVATLDADQLAAVPDLPDNVRAVDFVPLGALLPTCAAVVHHGGTGTFRTALAHRVPQVVLPNRWWDERRIGEALQQRGAGLCLADGRRVTGPDLVAAVARVLDDPAFAARADRLGRETAGVPTPAELVPALERLTAQHRAGGGRP